MAKQLVLRRCLKQLSDGEVVMARVFSSRFVELQRRRPSNSVDGNIQKRLVSRTKQTTGMAVGNETGEIGLLLCRQYLVLFGRLSCVDKVMEYADN